MTNNHSRLFCLDYNECINDHNCHHKNTECIDTREEFYCKCKNGFQGNETHCEGIISNCFLEQYTL